MIALLAMVAGANEPPVYSVGFLGRPEGLCEDRTLARQGRCVDVVDFLDLERAFGTRPPRLVDLAAWRTVSKLYAHAWEDLAYRWTAPDVEQTLRAAGYTQLPSANAAWKQSMLPRGAYALPSRDTYLGIGVWLDPVASPSAPRNPGAFFPHVRYAGPEGQEALPRTVLLKGRFAQRLGFNGRRHDFDIMDGDPGSSGPFFEQMFPYNREISARLQGDDTVYTATERQPLTRFRFPRHLHDATDDPLAAIQMFERAFGEITAEPGLDNARSMASEEFRDFTRVVYVQAAQYAMEDFTRNQMRVLAALTGMATPPTVLASDGSIARDLVAAARGETDSSAEIVARFDESALRGVPSGVHIRYERLPFAVVEPWVTRLHREMGTDAAYYDTLNDDIGAFLSQMLRDPRERLETLDRKGRRDWLRESLLPGNDREEVDAELLRLALARLLEQMELPDRERIEAWMLVDHARLAIAATFDESRVATPAELVDASTVQWQQVLALHGYPTQLLPQGLGAVDPTSICTTRDGLEGLEEPVFRTIDVDILTAAPSGSDLDTVVERSQGHMPFVFLDDPMVTTPELEELVQLGDGNALYRMRWSLWTGWHLLWDLAPAAGGSRLILRTAAFCDDMVLTDPGLAPTVIRAGLLAGNLRPSVPERGKVQVDMDSPELDAESVSGQVAGAPDAITGGIESASNLKDAATDPSTLESVAGLNPGVGPSAFELVQEELRPEVEYLRDIAYRPLDRTLPDAGGLLFVADVGAPGEGRALNDWVPRTPYTRVKGRVRGRDSRGNRPEAGKRRMNSAGWMWFSEPDQRPVLISPSYAPKDSVTTENRIPRWSRRQTADYGVTFGTGMFPWRAVRYRCETAEPGVANACANEDAGVDETTILSEGFSLDFQGLATWWFHDRPRMGVDVGLEVRMDLRHGGESWWWKNNANGVRFNWTLRPAAGIITGLRFAPSPKPLHRRRSTGATWGSTRQGGDARLGRTQYGLRSSILVGPGFNGTEATLAGEGWLGFSSRRSRGRNASFTPYQPRVLIGPFGRLQAGIPLTDGSDPARFLLLRHSWTAVFGIRTHLGLKAPAPKGPEIE